MTDINYETIPAECFTYFDEKLEEFNHLSSKIVVKYSGRELDGEEIEKAREMVKVVKVLMANIEEYLDALTK